MYSSNIFVHFKNIIGAWGIALSVFFITGCKKFLGVEPDSRVVLKTEDDLSMLLTSSYPQADYQTFTEAASDNVADKGVGPLYLPTRQNTDAYFFKEDIESIDEGSPTFYWKACYKAIASANHALLKIQNSGDSAKYFTNQKGEALLCRAYAHFQLVSLFSKSYNATSASTDLGVPYVTEVETVVFKKYDRRTVQYTYDMIEKDMLEGMGLINDQSYTVRKYHFNKDAAYAFASRFYLFKKDFGKSLAYSKKVLGGQELFQFAGPTNFQQVRGLTINEALAYQNRATEPSRFLLVEALSTYGGSYWRHRYGLTPRKKYEIFDSTNAAGATFGYPWYTGGGDNMAMLRYFPYERKTSIEFNSPSKDYAVLGLFTVEEIIFNIIEANIQLNNFPEAVTDLDKYVKFRMVPIVDAGPEDFKINEDSIKNYYKTTDFKQALINTFLDFKRGEFCQMGMRWFDILRYNLPVNHTLRGGGDLVEIHGIDPRKTFQIPLDAKYSGLPKNPRK